MTCVVVEQLFTTKSRLCDDNDQNKVAAFNEISTPHQRLDPTLSTNNRLSTYARLLMMFAHLK